MGYRNRTIRKDFEDLGDGVYVTIRNPKIVSMAVLTPPDIQVDGDGKPVDSQAGMEATFEVLSRLIVDWCVYDPADDSDDPPPLGSPTVEAVKVLPAGIVTWLIQQMTAGVSVAKPGDHQDPN